MDNQAAENLNTIVAAFSNRTRAEKAAAELIAIGVDRNLVKVFPETEAGMQSKDVKYDKETDARGLIEALSHLVLTEEQLYLHAERMHHGIVMVSALVDENHAGQAEKVLENLDPVDIDEIEINSRMVGDSASHSTHRRRVQMYAAKTQA